MFTVRVVSTDATRAHVAVTGVLDLSTGDTLLRKLTNLIDRGYVHLVLDASGVSFCDSAGLGAVLRSRARASAVAGSLVLADASPPLRKVLSLAGLDKLLAGQP